MIDPKRVVKADFIQFYAIKYTNDNSREPRSTESKYVFRLVPRNLLQWNPNFLLVVVCGNATNCGTFQLVNRIMATSFREMQVEIMTWTESLESRGDWK